MQQILSYVRRAVDEFSLIEDGDKIAVGVSGGKDSMLLLVALAKLKSFYPKNYEIKAITLDMGFGETDYSEIQKLCDSLEIEYHIKKTDIAEIIFDIRKEKNPCSLCARMRRGALHDMCNELGCNKVALGHHNDDVLETFFMNLFNEGRLGVFQPKTYLSRKNITLIRPLVFTPEKDIKRIVKTENIPIVKSKCPQDKEGERQKTKEFIREMVKKDRGFKVKVFTAIRNQNLDGFGFKNE